MRKLVTFKTLSEFNKTLTIRLVFKLQNLIFNSITQV